MHGRLIALVLLLACLPPVSAGELSAAVLAARLTGTSHSDSQVDYFAKGYLDGMLDATEGTVWCQPAAVKLDHDFDIELLRGLTKEGPADIAVASYIESRYPCTGHLPHPSSPRLESRSLKRAISSKRDKNVSMQALANGYITAVLDAAKLTQQEPAKNVSAVEIKAALQSSELPVGKRSAAKWILHVLRS